MTIRPPQRLLEGYRRFKKERYPSEAERFAELARGQAPATMVIACADSRVDPATIFSAAPGELFVVRNVAALVPPYQENAGYHGTSAALEFAVTGLQVTDVVVLGHGLCGGIAAALTDAQNRPVGRFIKPWVDLLSPMRDAVVADDTLSTPEERQLALELLGVKQSLANLATFPFVQSAVDAATLKLHGAWFSIANAELHWLNDVGEDFERQGV
jgi:carbonic anhydrase